MNAKSRRFPVRCLLLLLAGLLPLASCEGGGSSSTETDINLSGRVLDGDGDALPGVVVTLEGSEIVDTTNAAGHYLLEGEVPEGLAKVLPRATETLGVLVFSLEGHDLARVSVTRWVGTLPDLQLVQRDVSGILMGDTRNVGRVGGVLTGSGISAGHPVTAEFFFNTVSSHYSGFLYFSAPGLVQEYAVYVTVHDSVGRLTGRSPTVPFNSNAGNVLMPAFNARNAVPKALAGRDTSLKVGKILLLKAAAVDSFGTVVKREWNLDGAGFRAVSGDTSILMPGIRRPSNNRYQGILRVTDDDGNTGLDTVRMTVTNDNPVVSLISEATASIDDTVRVRYTVTASDPEGIKWFLWDLDGDGDNEDTTLGNSRVVDVVFSATAPAIRKVIVTVQDNFDGITRDTAIVGILFAHSPLSFLPPVGGPSFNGIAWTGSLFVAVGSPNAIHTSPDGVTWTARAAQPLSLNGVVWGGDRLVAVGSGGARINSSTGVTWNPGLEGGTAWDLMGVVWTGSLYLAVGAYGTVRTSTDGAIWTAVPTSGVASLLRGVAWTGSRFVAVGDYGIHTSPNGAAWTRISGADADYHGVVWTGRQLVAVGAGGTISTSPDGSTWTSRTSGTTSTLRGVTWTGSQLVVVGDARGTWP